RGMGVAGCFLDRQGLAAGVIIRRHTNPGRGAGQGASERLEYDQQHHCHQQQDRNFVEPAVEPVRARVAPLFELAQHHATGMVVADDEQYEEQLGMHPAVAGAHAYAIAHIQPQPQGDGDDGQHGRKAVKTASHGHQGGLHGVVRLLGEVDVDARQVKQAREPGRNENDVKGLDPEHGGASDTTKGNGCIVVKDGALPVLPRRPTRRARPFQAAQGCGPACGGRRRCAGQMTYRSTYSCTAMASRVCWSRDASRMRACWRGGKMRARLVRNLASSNGMPSWRRRLWPMGYSQATSSSRVPSLNSTVSAFAMERLSGSW